MPTIGKAAKHAIIFAPPSCTTLRNSGSVLGAPGSKIFSAPPLRMMFSPLIVKNSVSSISVANAPEPNFQSRKVAAEACKQGL